jgi:hypothetical protein
LEASGHALLEERDERLVEPRVPAPVAQRVPGLGFVAALELAKVLQQRGSGAQRQRPEEHDDIQLAHPFDQTGLFSSVLNPLGRVHLIQGLG